jgi:hypothetical protein
MGWNNKMFEAEQRIIEEKIRKYCTHKSLPEMDIQWVWIPFNGQWGISTSFFKLAAKSFGSEKGNTSQKATEIAKE